MKSFTGLMLRQVISAALVLAPTAACATPTKQAAPRHAAATNAAGATLSTFVCEHREQLLAVDTDGTGLLSRTGSDAMLSLRFQGLGTKGDGMLGADERAAAQANKAKDAGVGLES